MGDRYLYRAKRIDNGEWINGDLITTPFIRNETQDNIPYILDITKADYYCFEDLSEGNGIFEVDPSTICQCTGLKDKNGKLIWENDVLMCHGNKKDLCKVCFGEFKVIDIENTVAVDIVQGWYYKPLETDGLSKCEPFCYEMPLTNYYIERMDAEVIGNIFDNKELLESED